MNRSLKPVCLFFVALAAALATGCTFKSAEGRNLNLKGFDSIIIESVRLHPTVREPALVPLVAGYTAVAALEDDNWKLAGDFDLDAFAATIEEYSTSPHTFDGKPIEPLMTREEFLEKNAEVHAKWKAKLSDSRGVRPLSLRILVTELRFPDDVEKIVVGTNPRLLCTIEVFDGPERLGSADMEAIAGLPGIPFYPSSMATRVAKDLIFDEMQRETILKLSAEMGQETIDALSRAQ